MHARLAGIVTAVMMLMLVTDVGLADPYDKQRELFVAAESALNSGEQATFRDLKRQLTDYPLYSYLEYWQLRRRLSKAGAGEVQAFLDQYQEQPVATRLRISWLHQLGKRKDWSNYLRFYQPQRSVTLQCYDVRARLSKGDREQALQDALELWLVGYSQPDACDPAFDQLYASSRITSEQIWTRIRLAFANQKSSLAGYLAKRLSAEDREWVKRWQYAHRRPTDALSKPWSKQDTPLVREILTHACLRLARHKPEQAWKHWQEIAKTHRFSEQQAGKVLQRIALTGALRNHPQAAQWLASVPDHAVNADIRQWRVRVALSDGDWKDALRWIEELDATERNAETWRYWRAYALEADGASGDAFTEYARLAGERSYYGFLAADHLQRPYQMNDSRISYEKEQLEDVEQIPGIPRVVSHNSLPVGARTQAVGTAGPPLGLARPRHSDGVPCRILVRPDIAFPPATPQVHIRLRRPV
jgi:soluble lytic murein transglycosylase